jgi:RNA polymerase sigma-70 factor (ECF subfamily)
MSPAAMSTRIPLSQADDTNLMARLVGGEAKAFDQLVALYQQRVARLAYRLLGRASDVDDVVQEVFLVVLRKCGRFRNDCSIWTWLTTITLNQCRSRQRRLSLFRGIRRRLTPKESESPADRHAIQDETYRRVRAAVDGLPSRDREVIVLHYLEGHQTAQIAKMLGAAVNTIEVRLHRARQKLKGVLADIALEFRNE